MANKKRIKTNANLSAQPIPQLKRIHTACSVSFRYMQSGSRFCLSHCKGEEIREAMDCLRQLTQLTWQNVLQTGGKGANKAGLAYTHYDDSVLQKVQRPTELSLDVRIAAIRATQKFRIFGAYIEHIFYILWFDRNHEILPS